jgi:hypothetical protein
MKTGSILADCSVLDMTNVFKSFERMVQYFLFLNIFFFSVRKSIEP